MHKLHAQIRFHNNVYSGWKFLLFVSFSIFEQYACTDQLHADYLCKKSILFVRFALLYGFLWRRNVRGDTPYSNRDRWRQVVYNVHTKCWFIHAFIFNEISFFCICSVRGTLNTILVVATSGGTLLGLLAGHFLGYAVAPRLFLLFPVVFIVTCSFMPETPYYLMKVNRMEVCTRSLNSLLGVVFSGPSNILACIFM